MPLGKVGLRFPRHHHNDISVCITELDTGKVYITAGGSRLLMKDIPANHSKTGRRSPWQMTKTMQWAGEMRGGMVEGFGLERFGIIHSHGRYQPDLQAGGRRERKVVGRLGCRPVGSPGWWGGGGFCSFVRSSGGPDPLSSSSLPRAPGLSIFYAFVSLCVYVLSCTTSPSGFERGGPHIISSLNNIGLNTARGGMVWVLGGHISME